VTTCSAADLEALIARFAEQGRARQELLTVIRCGPVEVARHRGLYTALRHAVSTPASAPPAPSTARKSAA
jgi:hypothetical protein